MNPAQIVAALFALGTEIANSFQLSNDEIKAEIEAKLAKESEVDKAFRWYNDAMKSLGD